MGKSVNDVNRKMNRDVAKKYAKSQQAKKEIKNGRKLNQELSYLIAREYKQTA